MKIKLNNINDKKVNVKDLINMHFVLIIKPTRCTNFSNLSLEQKSTYFGKFLCPSSGVLHCTQQLSSILILLTSLYDIYHCCVYSEKLLMMDKGTVRNMYSFIPKINLRN